MARLLVCASAQVQGHQRRFELVAYTGEPLKQDWIDAPIVVDLATVDISAQRIPALFNHQATPDCIVGQTDSVQLIDGRIIVTGCIVGESRHVQEITTLADDGFNWQVSIGADPGELIFIERGRCVEANGRSYQGPVYLARNTVIREVSFVVIGADQYTAAKIAASLRLKGKFSMAFEEWVASLGFTVADLSEQQAAALKATFAQLFPDAPTAPPPAEGEAPPVQARNVNRRIQAALLPFEEWLSSLGFVAADLSEQQAAALKSMYLSLDDGSEPEQVEPAAAVVPDPIVANYRKTMAAEIARMATVRRVCAQRPDLEEKAVREGWTAERAELEVLRASRATPNVIVRGGESAFQPRVLAAALANTGKLRNIEKQFDERTLEAAHRAYPRGLGLQDILLQSAWSQGWAGHSVRSDLRGLLRAAFSNVSLPGILSNNVNKFLLQGYSFVEDSWSKIAAKRSVTDFKTITSYRLIGRSGFAEVGPTGELKHGGVSEESYTNRARTYGEILSLTREDIINDDLGALTTRPEGIGYDAATKLNEVFWTEFLDNASFFASGNNNYISGSTTVLSAEGVRQAMLKFRKQVTPQGKPIAIEPKLLLVPPDLEETAMALLSSDLYLSVTTEAKVPNRNVWANKFEMAQSSYLSNTSFTGYSTTAWYLLASPMEWPTIEVCFLDGVETPTVETADADFNVLGVQMRGYFDFGVKKQDYRGGVKSKGAA
jgi:hypothetical protein